MGSIAFIQWCIDNLNYYTITILMAIESSFIPIPSEVVIPPAAYEAAATGHLNVVLIVLFGTIGSIIGSLTNYAIAVWLGRPLFYRFANSRIGHMCLLSQEKVEHVETYFERHGAISIFIGRLMPAIRHLISIPAGLAKMKLSKFIIYTTLGAGLWNIVLASMGYYLESIVPKAELMSTVMKYSHEIGLFFLCVALFIIVFFAYQGTKKKKSRS